MGTVSLFLENTVFERQGLCFQLEAHLLHSRETWSLWNILWQSSALSNWKSVGWEPVEPGDIKKSICIEVVSNLQAFLRVLWRGVETTKGLEKWRAFHCLCNILWFKFPLYVFCSIFLFQDSTIMPCRHIYRVKNKTKPKNPVYSVCF